MLRLNGVDYNASVSYPAEKIVIDIFTEDNFNTMFTRASLATDVLIVNDGNVIASYASIFNGIEKTQSGYKVIYNRAPMTVGEVESLQQTVSSQQELLNQYATSIREQGNTIAQHEQTIAQQGAIIQQQSETISNQSEIIAEQAEQLNVHDETLNGNTSELEDILAAITELGDLIAPLLEPVVGGE